MTIVRATRPREWNDDRPEDHKRRRLIARRENATFASQIAIWLVERVFDTVKGINAQGVTIFMVEQNANMALTVANRGYVLQTGQIVLEDTAANLLRSEMVRRTYLGDVIAV